MSIELYAARHGETMANLEGRLAGKDTDSPLTEDGAVQARLLGDRLRGIHFDKMYCSPLQRAVHTLKIAFGEQCEFCVDDRLAEIGLGVMDGLNYGQADGAYPEAGMRFFLSPSSYKAPLGGETIEDVIKRVQSFLADVETQTGKTIFLQTHGFLLRVLYACIHDGSVSSVGEAPCYPNCAVVHYTYRSGRWELG